MLRAVLLLAALALLAPAAALATPREDLEAAQARFAALGVDDYSYIVRARASGPDGWPRAVVVRDGATVGTRQGTLDTVPALFAQVATAVDLPADQWAVTYDSQTGVPTEFGVTEESGDSRGFDVSDFAVGGEPPRDEPAASIADGSAASALAAARKRWRQRDLRDYDFRVELRCAFPTTFCGPHAIRVRKGKGRGPQELRDYATVPKLFRAVARAIEDGVGGLEVVYGGSGIPRRIKIDVDRRLFEDELTVTATRLRPRGPRRATAAQKPVGDEVDASITDGSAARDLAAARERWRARKLTDYDFRLEVLCFCTPAFRGPHAIRVRDGRARRPGPVRAYATVPKLFRVVAGAIEDRVAGLSVTNSRGGVPRTISIDGDRATADDERTLKASGLRLPDAGR